MLLVNVNSLKEGCIIATNVFSKTNYPIIKEKTVITEKHIEILKLFLIKEVEILDTLVSGEKLSKAKLSKKETDNIKDEEETDFVKLFIEATKKFEVEFKSWQSGISVDVTKIRSILIPLFDELGNDSSKILTLHHYTTKENYLYHHSIAVGLISGFIASKLNYPKGDILQIAMTGCLADCGMAKIDPKILNKESSLTREEFNEIKKHPIYSFRMIEKTPFLKDEAKLSIYQHHERLDGSGYPLGEKSELIHPYARIVAVADVFHAMVSERLYQNKRSPFKVIEMLLEDFFGQFDISVIQKLSSLIMTFSIGSKVQLSDGRIAEIMFIDQKHPSRPLVKVIDTSEIIQLVEVRQLYIQNVI